MTNTDILIERPVKGQPHKGKVLAVIGPHSDDFSIFAAGTVIKLLNEGYTGYFIRVTNDDMDSYDLSQGETVQANERDTQAVADIMGIKKVFHLNYRNHFLDEVPPTEIRSRLIFLFRLLRVDTVFSFDPWAHDEENPDHYVTAQAVEAACWMANGRLDYPEHFEAGLSRHRVSEKYYWARGPHLVNRVVDISSLIETKIKAVRANKTQILNMALGLRDNLAKQHKTLPWFSAGEETIIHEYVNLVFRKANQLTGQKYGLDYAEEFHYIGPDIESQNEIASHVAQYLDDNAVPLVVCF
ncbi:MAG: PIG-L family deacetylase [Anaerolineae bacterium]|nr:PIG-L family deacetylase [Anaerolineae bacterium]